MLLIHESPDSLYRTNITLRKEGLLLTVPCVINTASPYTILSHEVFCAISPELSEDLVVSNYAHGDCTYTRVAIEALTVFDKELAYFPVYLANDAVEESFIGLDLLRKFKLSLSCDGFTVEE